MDPHLLAHVLSQTFVPDTSIRQSAEHQLTQLEGQAGYPSTLLHIIVLPEAQLPFAIKQAAILRLKHHVSRHWDIDFARARAENGVDDDDAPSTPYANPLTPHDRAMIRDNMFEAIVQQSSPLIRVQLLECTKSILKVDYPHAWPALLPTILSTLRTNDLPRVYGALLVLSTIYKRWTFVEPNKRDGPVDTLTKECMPLLLPIFQHLSTTDSNEAYEVLRVVCRIVFLATQMRISPSFRTASHCLPVFNLLIQTVSRPVPAPLLSSFTSSHNLPPTDHPLWKAKRWALNCLVRVFSRWGQPLAVKDKKLKPFAMTFSGKVALPAFTAVIGVLKEKKEGVWISPRVLQLSYVYLSYSLKMQSLRKLQQENLSFLIEQGILPVLSLTQDDIALFINDPHEFIRQSLDLMAEYDDPRVAACSFLIDLVQIDAKRKSNEALQLALALIDRIFRDHALHPTSEQSIIVKEGAMRMLGALRKILLSDEALHSMVEGFLSSSVIPELSSAHGFVRSRAINLLGRYSKLEWKNKDKQAESIVLICQCLQPPNTLPVRLESAAAISRLVRDEGVLDFLRPQIPLIFSTFFDLMDEIGNEEVLDTLQALLGQVGEDVEPFAAQVVQRLTTMCLTLLAADEDDDESRLAANGALRTISALFYALGQKPDVIKSIESITYPLITAVCLKEEGVEDFEDGVELIHCIIDHSSNVSPFMWSAFPIIVNAYSSWAYDYLQQIAAVTDLYTAHGGEVFVQGSVLVNGTEGEPRSGLDVVVKLVLDIWKGGEQEPQSDVQELNQQYACKMIESILAHHKGKVDHLLPLFLRLSSTLLLSVTKKKDKKKHNSLILGLLDVISAVCYYSPPLFLTLIEQASLTQSLFNVWLSYVDSDAIASSFHHQRMSIIALSSLFSVPLSSLPPLLRSAFPDLVTLQVKRLSAMVELYKVAEEEDMLEEEWNEDDDDDDEYTGATWDEDELEDEEGGGGGLHDEDKEEMEEGEEGEDGSDEASLKKWEDYAREHDQAEVDEAHFPSPLDDVDEFITFVDGLTHYRQLEPTWSTKFFNSVNKEKKVKEAYEAVVKKAEEQRQKIKEEKEMEEAEQKNNS